MKDGAKVLKVLIFETRWNSIVASGKRFLEILPSLLKALKHKDIRFSITWSEGDTEILKELFDVLEPARVARENLSNSSINILIGEGVLKFLKI